MLVEVTGMLKREAYGDLHVLRFTELVLEESLELEAASLRLDS